MMKPRQRALSSHTMMMSKARSSLSPQTAARLDRVVTERRGWQRGTWHYLLDLRHSSGDRSKFGSMLRDYFRHQDEIDRRCWAPFVRNAYAQGAQYGCFGGDPISGLLCVTAEVVFRWAWRFRADQERPASASRLADLRAAAAELKKVDSRIRLTVAELASLIRRRNDLEQSFGMHAEWASPGLDLWELIESAAARPKFTEWNAVSRDEREAFLRVALETTMPGPELVDVLEAVGAGSSSEPLDNRAYAATLQSAQGQQSGSEPDWLQQLFSRFERQRWKDGHQEERSVLDCVSGQILSPLILVAVGRRPADHLPKAFTPENLQRNLSNYRRRRADAENIPRSLNERFS